MFSTRGGVIEKKPYVFALKVYVADIMHYEQRDLVANSNFRASLPKGCDTQLIRTHHGYSMFLKIVLKI